jgi:hypothetical protein
MNSLSDSRRQALRSASHWYAVLSGERVSPQQEARWQQWYEQDQDYSKAQNLILTSVILIIGVSGAKVHIGAAELKGMALATIVGIALSLIFKLISVLRPEEVVLDAEDSEESAH